MQTVFFLVSDLAPDGDSATARVLALGLPRDRFRVAVGVLGPATGLAVEELRAADVAIHSVPIRHLFDLDGVRRFRRVVREGVPAVIHTFGSSAARLARLVLSRGDTGNTPRLVVSCAAMPGSGVTGWLAARQIRRADRVIPATRAEGDRYRGFGVPGEILTRIAPAAPEPLAVADRDALLLRFGVPPGARIIVASGSPHRGAKLKDAIAAFDMLRYDAPDLHLVIFGAGSAATSLEHFGRALAFDDYRVHFADPADRAAAVGLATAVWVADPWGGADEVLEAMAAGKPVVGWNTADLAEVMDDRVTGFLVPPGDRAALATAARILLEEPAKAAALGAAGRARAAERFGIARMVEQFARVYAELGQ
jgi:glycosyltransferase involved in cell wall biosynthesis